MRAIAYLGRFLAPRTERRGDVSWLAEQARTSQGYVSELRAGQGNPTLDVVDRLAAAYGMDTVELFRLAADEVKSGQEVPKEANVPVSSVDTVQDGTAGVDSASNVGGTSADIPRGQAGTQPSEDQAMPSINHRAVYGIIAALSSDELRPIAELAFRVWIQHLQGGRRDGTTEGD